PSPAPRSQRFSRWSNPAAAWISPSKTTCSPCCPAWHDEPYPSSLLSPLLAGPPLETNLGWSDGYSQTMPRSFEYRGSYGVPDSSTDIHLVTQNDPERRLSTE